MALRVSLAVALVVALALLFVAACFDSSDKLMQLPTSTPEGTEKLPSDTVRATWEACTEARLEGCNEQERAARLATLEAEPTPDVDPEIRQVFFADDLVRQLIGDGVEREDFWLIIDQFPEDSPHGDQGGMVTIAFAAPVSYSGIVPTRTNPCEPYGEDERVEPDDPCLDEPREYGTKEMTFADVRVVYTQVDTARGGLVWVFVIGDESDRIVDDMIEWADATQY